MVRVRVSVRAMGLVFRVTRLGLGFRVRASSDAGKIGKAPKC